MEQRDEWTAGSLALAVEPIPDTMWCGAVLRRFMVEFPDAPAFPVIASQGFGLIGRMQFLTALGAPYARELYERRPIALIMDHDPLVVEHDMGIEDVGAAIADSKPDALLTGFIVTQNGEYAGTVTGVDLLRATNAQTVATLERVRSMQKTLVESEKLASLGSLVSGVAHEINTPIGITLTAATQFLESLQTLHGRFDEGSLRKADLTKFIGNAEETTALVIANARRAAELVQSFKQIAVDQQSDVRRAFDLREYIDDVLRSLRPRLKKTAVAIDLDVPAGLILDSYPGALSQVLTNLITNALQHAFGPEEEGRITINGLMEGETVQLCVWDNGCGIRGEHLPRIFEPFFTTKRGEGGSGLGLNITYNIVTRVFGGTITVDSAPGNGTRFVMRFPRTAAASAGEEHAPNTARFGTPTLQKETPHVLA